MYNPSQIAHRQGYAQFQHDLAEKGVAFITSMVELYRLVGFEYLEDYTIGYLTAHGVWRERQLQD